MNDETAETDFHLASASTGQLLDELRKRYRGVVIIGRANPNSNIRHGAQRLVYYDLDSLTMLQWLQWGQNETLQRLFKELGES